MTGFGTHADRERLLHSGFKACLLKPFTPDKLVETILSVLKGRLRYSTPFAQQY
jgi:DNA-binding NarL/FixJ family response regulator